jgi:nucleotide-binding universal stress UspA family protein
VVEIDPAPERAILRVASRSRADLIVLGTSVRAGTRRLHLGPRVEAILAAAPCPVVVLNA